MTCTQQKYFLNRQKARKAKYSIESYLIRGRSVQEVKVLACYGFLGIFRSGTLYQRKIWENKTNIFSISIVTNKQTTFLNCFIFVNDFVRQKSGHYRAYVLSPVGLK